MGKGCSGRMSAEESKGGREGCKMLRWIVIGDEECREDSNRVRDGMLDCRLLCGTRGVEGACQHV